MDTVSMLNKMSFYCQPILPLVYDESMSYYETLCKVVGQLNTTGETVNKLNEGLTGEITDRQAADAELDERLKLIEATNAKIHFLVFDGANPNGGFPTRSELYQWVHEGDAIFTLLRTHEEGRGQIYAASCSYNAGNWGSEASNDFSIIVPIETSYDATRDYAVKQKVAKLTIPPISQTNLNVPWGLQIIEVNTPYTSAEGVVNIVAVINDSDSVNCSITPSEFLELYNMTRGGKNLCVAVNAKLAYDGLARSSSVATVDTTNRNIRIAFERDGGVYTENGVKQLNKTLDYIIGDVSTNVWTHETIDYKTLDFPRYEGFQFTRGADNVITTDDESTPNAVYTQYHANESGKLYQNLPARLIDTVHNTEYWNGTFDIYDNKHMTFTFVTSNYATDSDKMLVRVIELSADMNTTTWKYAEKEFELPITGSFTVDDALSDTSTNPVQNKVVTEALNGKASTAVASRTANGLMSTSDYIKLLGIEDGATNTVVDAELNANSTNPVQNKAVKAALDGKASTAVASQTANGLMSAEDKVKLDGIEAGATRVIVDDSMSSTSTNPVQNKIVKKYIDDHNFLPDPIPNGNAVQTLIVERASRGYKLMTFDNLELPGAAESTNAPQTRSVKYLLDRKASKDAATEESDGLMSAADKTKLDGIDDGANRTVVDEALDDNSTNPVQNKAVKTALDGKAGTAVASASTNGLMSKDDKAKLDGIEEGATRVIVDDSMSGTSTNPVQNKAVKTALDGKLDKTGGTLTGNLRVTGALFSGDGLSFGTGENIHFTKAADDAGKLAHGAAGVDDTVPLARLKVASPTEDDDAATKAYVDNNAAGAGAVRYDAAQTLDTAQQGQARTNIGAVGHNSPQFQGFLTLSPANAPLGTGVGLYPSGSGNDLTLDISNANDDTPTLLTGVKTPTDADTNAAATVEYVNAKLESGDVTVQNANLLDKNDTANQVPNKIFYNESSNTSFINTNGDTAIYFPVGKWGAGNYKFPIDYVQYGGDAAYRTALFKADKGYIKTKTSTAVDTDDSTAYILSLNITQAEIDSGTYYIGLSIRTAQLGTSAMVVKDMDYPESYIEYGTTTYKVRKLENELTGKKAAFCGDSICAGTSVGTASPIYGQGWAGIIGKKNGMTWKNLGVNGATVAETSQSTGTLIIVNQLAKAYPDADYIILEGGCNDFDQMGGSTDANKMGAITAVWDDSYVKTTFAGALEHLFYTAVTKHPKAKIGYIIPPLMGLRNWTQYETISYRVYYNLAIDICKKWGIPYIDLWYESPLNPNLKVYYDSSLGPNGNIADASKCYVDGQHLTTAGYELIAPQIEAWMRTL